MTIGAVLLAFLTGSDFAMAAAIEGGASGEAVLEAREAWFVPILVVTGVIFGLGWLSLAAAIRASHILDAQQTWIVVGALVVLTIALFIPMSGGQYLLALSAIVASWLIGYHMWNDANPVTTTQPSPA